MLSLKRRFDNVNGTTTRAFSVYQRQNKLAFFIHYGLSLGFGIHIMALGLSASYIRSQGISAITGGFVLLLLTTTGRTLLKTIVTKGSGTMVGYENMSHELQETEIKFGELIDADGDQGEKLSALDTPLDTHEERSDVSNAVQHGVQQTVGVNVASRVELSEESKMISVRAGFGVAREIGPLGRRHV